MNRHSDLAWWKTGIIYHIYPLSFMDSSGDGKGDIAGIISRLDHLAWLGIDAVWISPIYQSPMRDFGYDISDYKALHPLFGNMDEFDKLLNEAHARKIRLIMDLVPNHTSDQHPWFVESRSCRNSPKRDWYLWRDPAADGGPPTNWLSAFGGSGWEWDEKTRQYYYHGFLKEQPDLNLRNLTVLDELRGIMRFWLDKGVDGFRVDVMWHLIKDDRFRDNPPNPDYRESDPSYNRQIPAYSTDQPEVLEVVSVLRSVTDAYPERVLMGEVYLPVNEVVDYYGLDQDGAHLPSNFQLLLEYWNAPRIYKGINEYEASLPRTAWPNWVLSNHDRPRVASRVGPDQARVAALLLLTLRGTPTIYYGDEIGMEDAPISPECFQDPAEQRRDPQRTPMQWNASKNAGFTSGTPWIAVNENYRERNVELQRTDPRSMLSLYRDLIQLRRSEAALHAGSFEPVGIEGTMFAFLRKDHESEKRFLTAVNLGHIAGVFRIPGRFQLKGEIVFGTHPGRTGEKINRDIRLDGDEGVVVRIELNAK